MAGFYACTQVEDFGQQPTFDVDGFTAMTYLSSKRDKYPIYWIGWAHGAAKKVPQKMDARFYAGTTETVG